MNQLIRLKKIMHLFKIGQIDEDQFISKLFEIFNIVQNG